MPDEEDLEYGYPYLGEWNEADEKMKADEKPAHIDRLVQYGLFRDIEGDGFHGRSHLFSFCRGKSWEEIDNTWRCPVCGECEDWRVWHCKG